MARSRKPPPIHVLLPESPSVPARFRGRPYLVAHVLRDAGQTLIVVPRPHPELVTQRLLVMERIDGFLSIERFQSLMDETKLLSLSFWRDEAAVAAWRNVEHHRSAQKAGRNGVLRDYRLRVAHVLRDYAMNARAEAPADSRRSIG